MYGWSHLYNGTGDSNHTFVNGHQLCTKIIKLKLADPETATVATKIASASVPGAEIESVEEKEKRNEKGRKTESAEIARENGKGNGGKERDMKLIEGEDGIRIFSELK